LWAGGARSRPRSYPPFGLGLTDITKPSERRSIIEIAREARSAEAAEAEIERFISRRHDARVADEGERAIQDAWAESARRLAERERQQTLWDRLRYHQAMDRAVTKNCEVIVARHRAAAEQCRWLLGIDDSEATKGAA
jgi:hypothetical protein